MVGARRECSVTLGRPIRSPCIVRLPRRVMFWRSLLSDTRRASVAFALLLSTLPLATPSLAAELVVDNSDAAVSVKGKWTTSNTTAGFLGADYLYRTPGDGSSSVSWPFPAGPAGRYEVFARWSAGPNRAT